MTSSEKTNMNVGSNTMALPDINRLVIDDIQPEEPDIPLINPNEILENLQQRDINQLLKNPQEYLNPQPLIEGQLDNLMDDIDNLNLDIDNQEDYEEEEYYDEDEEHNNNPLYNKLIPFEVANYYCKEYFDDEDFINIKFELPQDLLEEIMESGNKTISEYFNNFINNIEIAEDDEVEMLYFNLYNNCVSVYDTILEHYMPEWYDYDGPQDNDEYDKFDDKWTFNCRNMLDQINNALTLGMTDESLEYLCNYNKEVYAGLFIILSRLKELFLAFSDTSAVSEFLDYNRDYNRDYRHITIRLVNNICVILLYLKFYYLNNSVENKEQEPYYSDKMITMEED